VASRRVDLRPFHLVPGRACRLFTAGTSAVAFIAGIMAVARDVPSCSLQTRRLAAETAARTIARKRFNEEA
jgi:hypothetical protein